jgi:hypothetical protein
VTGPGITALYSSSFLAARHADHGDWLAPWARLWEYFTTTEFLRTYRATLGEAALLPSSPEGFRTLLGAYLLDKALHELRYELDHRPAWINIPAGGILSLLQLMRVFMRDDRGRHCRRMKNGRIAYDFTRGESARGTHR